MLRPLIVLALAGGCTGGDIDFGQSESTTPTVDFDIPTSDVDTDRPVDLCVDVDGDGWGTECPLGDDCDDTDPDVNGGVPETPYDGIDNDCKASTRDDDLDNDGFCTLAGDEDCPATDCDDDDRKVNPDEDEICNNGIDDDCTDTTPDVQDYGSLECPWDLTRPTCADVLAINTEQAGVDGFYELNAGVAWCDMTTDGGGFTLAMVVADDGVDSFTLELAADVLGTENDSDIGTIDDLESDYKSFAYDALNFTDLLFVHAPSDVWALYGDVGDASQSLPEYIETVSLVGTYVCDDPTADPYPAVGIAMTDGTLAAGTDGGTNGYQLCSTDLYFNRGDHDVDLATCEAPAVADDNGTFGPVWNAADLAEDTCDDGPFNDPAKASLGPDVGADTTETASVGWGWVTETNTGDAGTGANRMMIYIR